MFKKHNFDGKIKARFMPMIYLSEDAYHDMACLVKLCDDEIGWLATAYQWDNGDYHIDKVFLFEQEVNATTTEITPEGLAEWAQEMMEKDADEFLKLYENIRCWGHSHVRMDTKPSYQDDSQMDIWEDDCDFFIRVICNKLGKMSFDIFDYANGVFYTDCEWAMYVPDAEDEKRDSYWKEQIESKVSKKTYYSRGSNGPWKGSHSGKPFHSAKGSSGFTPSDKPDLDDDDDYYEVVRGYHGWGDDNWDLDDYENYFKERKESAAKVSSR